MSFLAPLYALAALAIGLPFLFHLIQRRPQGQIEFSSTMFLRPSPPRLTRRSRLDNILLFLLRAAAIACLAAGFARPFLRSVLQLNVQPPSRRIVVAVDASASMRRSDLWSQAQQRVERVLSDLQPSDDVALLVFDDRPQQLVSFAAWRQTPPPQRAGLIRNTLQGQQPSWQGTDLGLALVSASDTLLHAAEEIDESEMLPPQIIVVTDLQEGSQLAALQMYEWPADVQVDVQRVRPAVASNAAATVLAATEEAGVADADEQLRVRVRNAGDSTTAQFQLKWEVIASMALSDPENATSRADESQRAAAEVSLDVHVPPGQQRVVRVSRVAASAAKLLLTGDEQPFDNVTYLANRSVEQSQVLFVGPAGQGQDDAFFFLQRAVLDNAWRRVTIERVEADAAMPALDPRRTPLMIMTRPVAAHVVGLVRSYVAQGGRLLLLMDQPEVWNGPTALDCLRQLSGIADLSVEEAAVADYAMWSRVDFEHELFRPFADPRFSDFTKIQFWRHRRLQTQAAVSWRELATFDDNAPALAEIASGAGRLWILTAGWQPSDSQLALSTKFIPLLTGMLDPRASGQLLAPSYQVGDEVPLPSRRDVSVAATAEVIAPPTAPSVPSENVASSVEAEKPLSDNAQRLASTTYSVTTPSGSRIVLDRDTTLFAGTTEPGIYELNRDGEVNRFAVNVAFEETRTKPLDPGELEQRGVKLGNQRSLTEIQDERRQMRDVELESRQKLWRWGILLALLAIGLETWWGDRRPRGAAVLATG